MITFGYLYKKEQEEYSKLTDEQVLQRLITYICKHYHKFDFDDVECKVKRKNNTFWYNRRYIKEYRLDDYELDDMLEFLEQYPYMKCISFEVLYDIQHTCNSDTLDAGWCGCFEPRYMLFCLEENS